jgi:hypothetical protein
MTDSLQPTAKQHDYVQSLTKKLHLPETILD